MEIKAKSIRDFIHEWDEHNEGSTGAYTFPNWDERLSEGGYYSVASSAMPWNKIHNWCEQEFGHSHYAWVGNVFWFETEEAAIWFALRWS